MDDDRDWPSEWLRGVLGLCVLRVLADGPTYGYAVATALADSGLGPLKGGTLYPLLKRLEDAGWVVAEWRPGEGGPGRKYYVLTGAGADELRRSAARWDAFTTTTRRIVADGATAPAEEEPA
ncbi:PadR family transcriptional regulator [Cellulosimicrobium sp. CUA-896]|uniref:PadR family transcriptional regulator n=1 Tax=Cellulosimicrobium sp. CUA-896 TaxID=1517881 RepID=UPI0009655085|nr:PadR family transcriptional regulator [Cellulosimicrobium sp. CUA-896]OLT48105.1 PadR family transcriptional regulator [Cellulosimicrobium sp. CUA-896]